MFGEGPECLLAFHGFGEDASSLRLLESSLGLRYTILAVNHLYHGHSTSKDENALLKPEQLQKLVTELQQRHGFKQFSLFGYSLGAKIALQLIELFPDSVQKIFLFAPDGIVMNRWYNLAIRYRWSRKLFLSIVSKPGWFLSFVRWSAKLKLISPSREKFVLLHMETEEKRRMVYRVWHVGQLIVPNIDKIKKTIKKQQIDVRLFFGKRDRIIPPAIGHYFCKGIEDHCKLQVMDSGHQLLISKNLAEVKW